MSDLWSGRDGGGDEQGSASGGDDGDGLFAGRGGDAASEGRPSKAGRSRRRGVSRRTRTTARVLLAVLVVGVGGIGLSVAIDLLSVRSSLTEARTAIAETRTALGEVDVDGTIDTLEVAEEEIADAKRRADRPTWTVMTYAPFIGPSVVVTRDVVEVADAAVEAAGIAAREGQALLTDGLDLAFVDGRLDLQPIEDARALFAQLPIDRLTDARDRLATPTDGWLPEEVLAGRADTLELANETVDLLARGEALTAALPGFLGADEPKRYFMGFQTSAELRGTGGVIGYWAVLNVDDGRIALGAGEDYDPFDDAAAPDGESRVDRIRTIGLSPVDPPGVPGEFRARYGLLGGARSFPNINLDPDLPTAAEAILNLYELQTGDRLDGVVLLDPPGLQRLLEPTGERLPLPSDLAEEFGYADGLPIEEFSRFVTEDIYDTMGFDRSDERNDALRRIGDIAFTQVVTGGWETSRMIAAIATSTAERHLQINTTDPATQGAFRAIGATGSLELTEDTDRLALTANNAVGGKQDVHLGYRIGLDISLADIERVDDQVTAFRQAGVEVTVDNPLPSSGRDLYVIGSCYLPDSTNRCFEGDPGYNHTWFTLWTEPRNRFTRFRTDSDSVPNTFSGTFRDFRVLDHYLLTPPQSDASFSVDVDGHVPLQLEQEAVVYELDLWRQAKAAPDLLDIRVTPPASWAIASVEVVGGGTGRGSGVHGEGVELTAEVVDGVAVVQGTVTADTRVRVRLVDPASSAG